MVSGRDALKVAKNKMIHMDFVDIKITETDGPATELRQINTNIQIDLLTGYRDEVKSLIEAAMQNCDFKWLYKPFNACDSPGLVNQDI